MGTTTLNPITCDVPVFFATSEGQTRRIAERIAADLRELGRDSRAFDVAGPDARAVDWSHVRAAVVGASVHASRHQKQAHAFVRDTVARLAAVPSAFFSVSLSAASIDPAEQEEARRLTTAFPARYGWSPSLLLSIAGRLAYTQYGWWTRLLMKRIARKEGAPMDARRDHEFTNWEKVDRLAHALDGLIRQQDRRTPAA